MKVTKSHGTGIISAIIALVIIAVCIVVAVKVFSGGEESSTDNPIFSGKTVKCSAQLDKVRQEIQMFYGERGRFPKYLEELDLPESKFRCPVTYSAYKYEPATGKISCVDHP